MRFKDKVAWGILIASPFLLLMTAAVSIRYGAKAMDWETVGSALFRFDSSDINHQIIITSRVPRAVGTLLAGAALAVSGALMQGMTRNYLASPGLMGVIDGSALAITLCMALIPGGSLLTRMLFSLLGSAFGAIFVFGLGTILPGGLSPVRLAILGTVSGAFLNGLSAAIAIYYQIAQDISYWYNARLHQIRPDQLYLAAGFIVAGILMALAVSRTLTLLSLGEEVAVGLGQKTKLLKGITATAALLLTGAAVALAGKITFVGLMIPHITRFLVGADYKWRVPCAGVLGAVFLGLADLVSRFLNYPFETPVGVVTALTGVPFFLYLARTRGGKQDG